MLRINESFGMTDNLHTYSAMVVFKDLLQLVSPYRSIVSVIFSAGPDALILLRHILCCFYMKR